MKDLINKIRNKLLEHRAYELTALFFQGFLIGSLAMLTIHYIIRM
jgi:hypothetical protein